MIFRCSQLRLLALLKQLGPFFAQISAVPAPQRSRVHVVRLLVHLPALRLPDRLLAGEGWRRRLGHWCNLRRLRNRGRRSFLCSTSGGLFFARLCSHPQLLALLKQLGPFCAQISAVPAPQRSRVHVVRLPVHLPALRLPDRLSQGNAGGAALATGATFA